MEKLTANKRVYLDHAAATPLDNRVKSAMLPYLSEEFGNPGGLYREGRRAKETLDASRKIVASVLGSTSDEIFFTSGGTEGDALAIMGAARAYRDKGNHIITSTIEHHAVLHNCEALEKEGFDVTYVEVNEEGLVDPQKIKEALRLDTILVSIMYANNEIGTIQPIREIAEIIRIFRKEHSQATPVFHTDACQASAYLDLNVDELGADLMVLNGSKVYGPKGTGALYLRKGVRIKPLFYGGPQESRRRAGTENVAGIVGFAHALKIAQEERETESERLGKLRDDLFNKISASISRVVANGSRKTRLPNNVNVSILDIEGEAVLLYLDAYGIACSTGSACTSESLDPSHVILALGRPYEYAHASLRFSLGRGTSQEDIDYVAGVLPQVVETLRKISPIHVDENAKSMGHPEAFAGEGLRVKANSRSYK